MVAAVVAGEVMMYNSMWAASWLMSAGSMKPSSGTTAARRPYSRSSAPMFLFSLMPRHVSTIITATTIGLAGSIPAFVVGHEQKGHRVAPQEVTHAGHEVLELWCHHDARNEM